MIGLYDHQGVLRFAGRDIADCLEYAALFDLAPEIFTLQPLLAMAEESGPSRPAVLT